MSSGKETEFSEYVSERCGVFWKGDRVFLSTCPRGVVSSGKETEFLSSCPRGAVSSAKETEFSEFVSERCGVFCKGDRVF